MSFINFKQSQQLLLTTTMVCLISFNVGAYVHSCYPRLFWFGTNKSDDNLNDLIKDLESSLEDLDQDLESSLEDQDIKQDLEQNTEQLFDFSTIAERMANGGR